MALTRAKKFVQLSYTTSRFRWGQLIDCEPSRFLKEIDDSYLDWHFQKRKPSSMPNKKASINYKINTNKYSFTKRSTNDNKQKINVTAKFIPKNLIKANIATNKTSSKLDNSHLLQAGMQVEHVKFGKGKILQIEGTTGNKKAIVFFQSVGQKQLLLKFAKLKIIDL